MLPPVSPKNFKVKMIMKTSVLLSWEFPDNYNSPTPYKVRPPAALSRGGAGRGGHGTAGTRPSASRPGPPELARPQIQYNGLTLDVDGRTTKKLITHLKPHTFYNFVLTNRGSSLGGLQQTVTAWTAFNMLSGKPGVSPKPDPDGYIFVYLPDGQSPVPVQYAHPASLGPRERGDRTGESLAGQGEHPGSNRTKDNKAMWALKLGFKACVGVCELEAFWAEDTT